MPQNTRPSRPDSHGMTPDQVVEAHEILDRIAEEMAATRALVEALHKEIDELVVVVRRRRAEAGR